MQDKLNIKCVLLSVPVFVSADPKQFYSPSRAGASQSELQDVVKFTMMHHLYLEINGRQYSKRLS